MKPHKIPSPIVFNIYTADLTDWVKYSKLFNYADDTASGMEGKILELIIKKLEEDADLILSFMASNGLVANPKKSVFMILNQKGTTEQSQMETIRVGDTRIIQEKNTTLLGMKLQDDLGWKEHFHGKNGLISQLNK